MTRFLKYLSAIAILFTLSGCGIYSFTGSNISPDVKTFQVNYFLNNADIVEPGIERTFTLRLQDLIQNQTNLSLTNTGGDLVYEGEIVEYRVSPMTATADQRAAQNRLTIAVMVRFTNKKKEDDNFEKRFSFFYDYDGNDLPSRQVLNTALEVIFERITQDIFNDSLAKW
ncbi:MAG: LPS assembly lipoprotein LptE [Flavobacterium sp.]